MIYIEETPCKYLSLKLLDRKDEIPYQNGGQTDTHTDRQTEKVNTEDPFFEKIFF